jgi:hypothetical protein
MQIDAAAVIPKAIAEHLDFGSARNAQPRAAGAIDRSRSVSKLLAWMAPNNAPLSTTRAAKTKIFTRDCHNVEARKTLEQHRTKTVTAKNGPTAEAASFAPVTSVINAISDAEAYLVPGMPEATNCS